MRGLLPVILLGCTAAGLFCHAQKRPVDAVNERIGTANDGLTYPATGLPFAMTQWTPQTREGNVKCVPPYFGADTRIQGFRGSHFPSGSCTQDYGSVTLMPISGALKLDATKRASSFDRSSEKMTPYRYAVTLKDYGIDAEVTGATRAGLMRFRFNRAGQAWILVQANAQKGDGEVHIDAQRGEVVMVNPVRRIYAGAGKLAGFNGYAVVQFDHPFHPGGGWSGAQKHAGALQQNGDEGSPGIYLSFDLQPGETVQARIGTSFTSVQEARRNLEAEIPGWDFEPLAARVREQWNTALGRIEIAENAPQRRIFYTALYHTMLVPRVFSDVSGSYPGFGGEGRIEHAQGFTYYCDYSIWDTFRAVHPLLTILDPERALDMVKSLVEKGKEGGFLPIYPAWNSYTSEMAGDHADAIIGDAFVKGIRGFDTEEAYRLMKKSAMELPPTREEYLDGKGRRGLESYLKYGYIPLEDGVPDGFHKQEQVSRTLDYAYDDFIVGEMARALGHTEDAEYFQKRGQNYRNVIDPKSGFARGRHADGSWSTPFDPGVQYSYFTEGTSSQYTFFVPHDLPGLIDLVGGRKAFIEKLDAVFAGGRYDHGNEPSHHLAYLYDNAGAPWKAQEHVRKLLDSQYADTPEGLAGNDDCGQMSAWYVMSALGFYSVTPGTPEYQIGTPLFDEATIHLPSGKSLHIRAEGASAGKFYIHAATFNGVPLERYWIHHAEIVGGGELVFTMSSLPAMHSEKQ
jgi:predicted alpha-1,2-mannosidase